MTTKTELPTGRPVQDSDHRNDVSLVGRLSAAAVEKELPSGDLLCTWRLVVRRPTDRKAGPGARAPTVDTLDCVSWRADVRRAAGGWQPGDLVEVSGSLHRRFWQTGAGSASRCEVEVRSARRLRRPRSDRRHLPGVT